MAARMRGTIEPLALTAAIVAAGMAVFYVRLHAYSPGFDPEQFAAHEELSPVLEYMSHM
jgi:hypothetical protein